MINLLLIPLAIGIAALVVWGIVAIGDLGADDGPPGSSDDASTSK